MAWLPIETVDKAKIWQSNILAIYLDWICCGAGLCNVSGCGASECGDN